MESKKEYDDFSKVIYFMNDKKVEIICKKHGEYKISPNSYLSNHRCNVCQHNMLTKEEFELKIKEKFPHLIITSEFIDLTHQIKVKCNLCGYEREVNANKLLNSKCGCRCLGGNKKLTTEEYKLKIKGSNIECLEEYINNQTPILHKCLICNYEWKVQPTCIMNNVTSCPKCSIKNQGLKRRFSLEQINDKLKERMLICLEYNGEHNQSKFKCLKCKEEWYRRSGSVIRYYNGCPKCKSSSYETIISDWLKRNNIPYEKEYKFNDCKNKHCLPFDFYIPKYNILIEMQGGQHYKPVRFRKEMSDEECIENFKYRQRLDNIKKSYALENGYTFITISYRENIIDKLKYLFSYFI